ncbi:MAG TPA: TonB-dependent receptor, partial [Caulobacterales bacterium]|nr:TonB-dependent receptor [Caulobacterales bacterium]
NPPGGELKQLNYTQRDANFWGAEAKGSYDLAQLTAGRLQAVVLADMVRASFTGGGGDVPRIQPYRVGAGLDWSSAAFDASFLALYVGPQKRVPAGDTATDGYFNLDAQAAWRPFGEQRGLEVALVGHNLTDDVQRNAVSLNRDVVELPGRDVRVVLRQTF